MAHHTYRIFQHCTTYPPRLHRYNHVLDFDSYIHVSLFPDHAHKSLNTSSIDPNPSRTLKD